MSEKKLYGPHVFKVYRERVGEETARVMLEVIPEDSAVDLKGTEDGPPVEFVTGFLGVEDIWVEPDALKG